MPRRYPVSLTCDHATWFRHTPPQAGDLVYCIRCADYRNVIGPLAPTKDNWQVHCTQEGCIYTRWPATEDVAIRKADTHSLRMHHTVEVYDRYDQLVKIISPAGVVTKT